MDVADDSLTVDEHRCWTPLGPCLKTSGHRFARRRALTAVCFAVASKMPCSTPSRSQESCRAACGTLRPNHCQSKATSSGLTVSESLCDTVLDKLSAFPTVPASPTICYLGYNESCYSVGNRHQLPPPKLRLWGTLRSPGRRRTSTLMRRHSFSENARQCVLTCTNHVLNQ